METKSSNKINYTVNFEENLEEKPPDFKTGRFSKKTNKIEPACNIPIPPIAGVPVGKQIIPEEKKDKNYILKIATDKSHFQTDQDKLLVNYKESCCSHLCKALPLIGKNLKLKMEDHLLLGGEHNVKLSEGYSTPQNNISKEISSEEKTEIVLSDPKFGMFSLFKYHLRRGYLNKELKKSNKVYCSHIFSLLFALPIIVFIGQWVLYISLLKHEIKIFDGNYCPNTSSFESKFMMFGTGLIYFVKSFFIWDNLTTRIGLKKMHRVDSISVILDTFQEFLFNIIVYAANLWIIFSDDDIQNMILNSLAMEFLMILDNEFEEIYFKNLPGAAEDIYDNMYVTYETNKKLVKKKTKKG